MLVLMTVCCIVIATYYYYYILRLRLVLRAASIAVVFRFETFSIGFLGVLWAVFSSAPSLLGVLRDATWRGQVLLDA